MDIIKLDLNSYRAHFAGGPRFLEETACRLKNISCVPCNGEDFAEKRS
jgi:hypothetical protein